MGYWVSTDIGYGWDLGGGEDSEWNIPWLKEAVDGNYTEDYELVDEDFDPHDVLAKRVFEAYLPDDTTEYFYWESKLEKATGFQLEPIGVMDYSHSTLLLLSSRTHSSSDTVSEINASIFTAPFTDEEHAQIKKMAEVLGIEQLPLGWYLGAGYG